MRGMILTPKLNKASVKNNLTTSTAGYVLDARQGKALKDGLDVAVLGPSTAFSIPASGSSVSYNLTGLTAQHELTRWNFSSSAENHPPVKLSWSTYAGYFTITNNGGTTTETIRPVFALPNAIATTSHT